MLATILVKYGEMLIREGYERPGMTPTFLKYYFQISKHGKLIGIRELKEPERKMQPVVVYDDGLSNYSDKYMRRPSLFSIKLKYFLEPEVRAIFRSNLQEFYDEFEDEEVKSILMFLENFKGESFEEIDTSKNISFEVEAEKGDFQSILDDENLLQHASQYVVNRAKSAGGEMYCDILGEATDRICSNHSSVFGGMYNPRIVTTKTFNVYYSDLEDKKTNLSVMSMDAEIAINAAVNHIKDCREYTKGSKTYFLGCFGSPDYVPLFKPADVSKWIGSKLFYLEFDAINRGRISTYKAKIYNAEESKKILKNIKAWNDAYYIKKGENEIHMFPLINTVVKEMYFNPSPNDWDDIYSQFASYIIRGNFEMLIERYILKYKSLSDTNINMSRISKVIRRLIMNVGTENVIDAADFKAGRLLAKAYLLEQRMLHDSNCEDEMTYCEQKIQSYKHNPWNTWLMIRERIQGPKKSFLMEEIQNLEYDLLINDDFMNMKNLSAKMFVGFDIEVSDYWNKVRMFKKEEIQND